MVEFIKKHGIWGLCFLGFCAFIALMTFNSDQDQDAIAEETENEMAEESGNSEEDKDMSAEEQEQSAKEELLSEKEDSQAAQAVAVDYQEGMEEKTKTTLANVHEYLNQLTGWGQIESINMELLIVGEQWKKFKDDLRFLEQQGFAPSLTHQDIVTAGELVEAAEESGDREALRFIHRIFHDLDIHINETDGDTWGTTEAFGSEERVETVHLYLIENIEGTSFE
ncbi:hypothetical protein [Alteribacter populi]|uniref:hypothetical protein n=1 Tax=Alteribacter populi TaxID=2011011 RepID=UPI000BBAE48A|nr:hypothetical protein [Alteribacter populi]